MSPKLHRSDGELCSLLLTAGSQKSRNQATSRAVLQNPPEPQNSMTDGGETITAGAV